MTLLVRRSVAVLTTLLTASHAAVVQAGQPGDCATAGLVISELALSAPGADGARWVELHNPGATPVLLDKLMLMVSVPTLPGLPPAAPLATYALGSKAAEVAGGGWLVLGWKGSASAGPASLVELGYAFTLPCKAELTLAGPSGPIDSVTWDLCGAKAGAWSLDPAHLSTCDNDDLSTWCAVVPSPGAANPSCDLDGDGFGALATDGKTADCNDAAKTVFPGAAELCNGVDEDCDGETDEGVQPPPGLCMSQGVCGQAQAGGKAVAICDGKGGFVCSYPWGYESLQETLCDGHDNDCDGLTDEGLTNACGQCGALPAEVCNGIDDDCNGTTDEVQSLNLSCPQLGVCSQAKAVCQGGVAQCALPLSFEATETRCDGLDNDCDGAVDEEMGLGGDCHKGTGSCDRLGKWQCGGDGAVVCSAVPGGPEPERCGDGIDNDCDATTDEDFDVGSQCTAGVGACRVVGKKVCSATRLGTVCSAVALPPREERCANHVDDDCDGVTDETSCSDGRDAGCSSVPSRAPPAAWLGLAVAVCAVVLRRRHARP